MIAENSRCISVIICSSVQAISVPTRENKFLVTIKSLYFNVGDEALLGSHPIKQQWKGRDRCYAMAQYTGVNNGVEGDFCVVDAAVI
jgi:hypothetical protein